MTSPTNRTDEVKKVAYDILPDGAVRSRELIRELIASAITSAVEQERERALMYAAEIARRHHNGVSTNGMDIAYEIEQAIRQTPTKEGI